jgi:hypothetical protein
VPHIIACTRVLLHVDATNTKSRTVASFLHAYSFSSRWCSLALAGLTAHLPLLVVPFVLVQFIESKQYWDSSVVDYLIDAREEFVPARQELVPLSATSHSRDRGQ